MYFRKICRKKPVRRVRRRRVYRRRKTPMYKRPDQFRNGVPTKLHTKLNYAESSIMIVTAASSNYFVIQSSLYDPYSLAGGHQPLYFDQIAPALYGNYRVYGFKYQIMAASDSSTSANLITYPSPLASSAANYYDARERPGSKQRIVVNGSTAKITGYVSVAKTLGVSKEDVRTELSYSAAYNANPAIMANLIVQGFNGAATTININISWRVTYFVEFWNPTRVPTS